jgi:hypothetical protein
VTPSRSALATSNGLSQNGLTTNGLIENGFWQNGFWQNGFWQNGFWQNGFWQNGFWQNGFWQNGFSQNGFWQNGFWQNGLTGPAAVPGDTLRKSPYLRELLQYIYSCAMPPGTYDTYLDPNNGLLTCTTSDAGPDAGGCDDGYTCSPDGKCIIPLIGSVGVGVNADSSTWGSSGTCDESCQRWVSACVLARTNAYGVHVEISMRAPANAPQAIKDALRVLDGERSPCPAGSETDISCGYTLREGAYYGNIFATTPVNAPPSAGFTGPTDGPIALTPVFYACAGPGSNIPEITKRFCSSQGDQVVINVPGVCLATAAEAGTCEGEDTDPASPTSGAIQDCHTSTSQTDAPYKEVITVYLKQPIAVCGNAVCEAGEAVTADPAYCPSDCHPGTWARDFSPSLGGPYNDTSVTDQFLFGIKGMSAVGPDDTIVVAGFAYGSEIQGNHAFPSSAQPLSLAKYSPDGTLLWSLQFGDDPVFAELALRSVSGVAVSADGTIAVVGEADEAGELVGAYEHVVWFSTFGADGAPLGTVAPIGTPIMGTPSTGLSASGFVQPSRAITFDSKGNIVTSGQYQGVPVFGSTSLSGSAAWVAKLTPQGAVSWAVSIGPFDTFPMSLVVDGADDVLVVTGGTGNGTVRKMSGKDGSILWSKDSGANVVYGVGAVDGVGDVYLSGYLQSGQDFGGGPISVTGLPPFVAKFHGADGSFVWASHANAVCPLGMSTCAGVLNAFHSDVNEIQGASIGFDPSGNLVLGSFGNATLGGGIDFGLGTFPTYGAYNIFLSAYSSETGDVLWAKQVPTILGSSLLGMNADKQGHVIASGTYSGSMQFDDHLLITGVPEDPSTTDSFLASFNAPSPSDKTAPAIGTTSAAPGSPVLTVPKDITVPATKPDGAVVFFMPPTVIDTGNAGTSVACVPPPNTTFPLGSTTVTCTASDPLGNSSHASFKVTVVDNAGPVFTSTGDMTLQATTLSGAPFTPPIAVDQVDGNRPVTCKFASGPALAAGTVLPVGETQVTCVASDTRNNQSQISLLVTVKPTFGVPCSSTTDCAGGTCVDGVCCVATSCDQCSACNVPGSLGTCAPAPPTFNPGTNQTVLGSCSSAPIAFTHPTITNGCSATVTCPSIPGNSYGAHTVTCTATNSAGTSSQSSTVTVLQPLTIKIQPPLAGDNDTVDNVVKNGSTVPNKILLYACGTDVTSSVSVVAKLGVTYKQTGGSNVSTTVPTTFNGAGDTNGMMVFDGKYYHYNLATAGYSVTQGVSAFYQETITVAYQSAPNVIVGTDMIQIDTK